MQWSEGAEGLKHYQVERATQDLAANGLLRTEGALSLLHNSKVLEGAIFSTGRRVRAQVLET